ncbi:MAG: hypothetical protein J7L79_05335 [Thaumarchaeota archaeon]|nr:hypothetical protein [Nitrososphaerota archaeon]
MSRGSKRRKKGESKSESSGKRGKRKGRAGKREIDERLFKEAVRRAAAQPRLAFYSPVASCVLNYWKSAVPRFSISEFLAKVIEREIARAWPQLYEKAVKELRRKIQIRKRGA